MPFDLRLVAYDPNGARRGLLPHPLGVEVAWPLNDVPALRFSYSTRAVGADLISTPCEIGVQWSVDGNTWVEPGEGRFLLLRRQGDHTDSSGVWRFECPSYLWVLKKAVVYAHASIPPENGQRVFSAGASAGFIMHTLLTDAQTRGALSGFSWAFTNTQDSTPAAWAKTMKIGVPLSTDLLTVLLQLTDYGMLDFRMSGSRQLSAWNPDTTLLRDLSTAAAPVELRGGRDITAAPDVRTLEGSGSVVLVVGDNSFRHEVVNAGATVPWGRWELGARQVGVTDVTAANHVGTASLTKGAVERAQRTRELTLDRARWLPLRDYLPGDRIWAPGSDGVRVAQRIQQITLTRTVRGVLTGNLILNTRLGDQEVRLARRIAGLSVRP